MSEDYGEPIHDDDMQEGQTSSLPSEGSLGAGDEGTGRSMPGLGGEGGLRAGLEPEGDEEDEDADWPGTTGAESG